MNSYIQDFSHFKNKILWISPNLDSGFLVFVKSAVGFGLDYSTFVTLKSSWLLTITITLSLCCLFLSCVRYWLLKKRTLAWYNKFQTSEWGHQWKSVPGKLYRNLTPNVTPNRHFSKKELGPGFDSNSRLQRLFRRLASEYFWLLGKCDFSGSRNHKFIEISCVFVEKWQILTKKVTKVDNFFRKLIIFIDKS